MHQTWIVLKEAAVLWYDRDGDRNAAVVSYYLVFALVPLILAVVTLVGIIFGERFVIEVLTGWGTVLGPDLVGLIDAAVKNLRALSYEFSIPLVATLFFLGITIEAFNEFAQGLHTLWGVPYQGFKGYVKKCLSSVLFIIFLCVFVSLYITVGASVTAVSNTAAGNGIPGLFLMSTLGFVISLFFLTLLFAVAYRMLPRSSPPFGSIMVGALVSALLFSASKAMVALYLSVTPVPSLYGAAGLLLVLLIWIFASACILYFGAAVAYTHAKYLS